jgi:DNA-3-methyladenine glycosylase I
MNRCAWVGDDPLMITYHDTEWGVPNHDDRKIFEFMVLDAMQAGLSWKIVLHKREKLREVLHNFDPKMVAAMGADDVERLMLTEGIIRNRAKLTTTFTNAQHFLEVQAEFGSFDTYLWGFVGGQPKVNHFTAEDPIPATSPEGNALSADLLKRGFKFVGPTIIYAFMQGAGLVNDHLVTCDRYTVCT